MNNLIASLHLDSNPALLSRQESREYIELENERK